jgi:hypothetical protein
MVDGAVPPLSAAPVGRGADGVDDHSLCILAVGNLMMIKHDRCRIALRATQLLWGQVCLTQKVAMRII